MNICVWCHAAHETGLMLCPEHEQRAQQLKEAKGLPIIQPQTTPCQTQNT